MFRFRRISEKKIWRIDFPSPRHRASPVVSRLTSRCVTSDVTYVTHVIGFQPLAEPEKEIKVVFKHRSLILFPKWISINLPFAPLFRPLWLAAMSSSDKFRQSNGLSTFRGNQDVKYSRKLPRNYHLYEIQKSSKNMKRIA